MGYDDESSVIFDLAERLSDRFPQLSRDVVHDVVMAAHREFAGVRIRSFVPLLVEHDALDELSARLRLVGP